MAFPNESDFQDKLLNRRTPVELVRNRNNLCHGNVFDYFQILPETNEKFFSPECLKEIATTIKVISEQWATEIGEFRKLNILI